ncbi:hypothetical protein [Hyunsoonleella ulvae]|uniref:hypothetical protein n=1 Tax=Hyunsoonleella ulvae TaxID=2799948 RepID=UPI001939D4EB|nr:hypothetical protein [Hyunsoonleella ulvae]
MTFPIINISTEKWNDDDILDYILFSNLIYTDKKSIFDKYYRNKMFCDCNGKVFRVNGLEKPKEKWRNWLKFLPGIYKCKIKFEPTQKEMTVNELRNHFLNGISDLTKNDYTEKWILDIKNAENHSELINGKQKNSG